MNTLENIIYAIGIFSFTRLVSSIIIVEALDRKGVKCSIAYSLSDYFIIIALVIYFSGGIS